MYLTGIFAVLATVIFSFSFFYNAEGAAGVPKIISYQGRLTNSSSDLLGGSGTTFYFRFSLHSASSGGSQLWPGGTPCTHSLVVRQGVFNAGVGDTSECSDVLDFDFASRDAVWLEVKVSSDNSTFETLTPRQRISSTAFAVVADTLVATSTQSRVGTTSPIDTSLLTIESTTTSVIPLTIRAAFGQLADLFQIQDSRGTDLLTITGGGAFGIGSSTVATSTKLTVAGDTYLDSNVITISSSTAANLTVSYQSSATTTLPVALNAFSYATSTTAIPFFEF